MCKNIGLCMDILDFETASELLISGTGLHFTPDRIDRVLKDQIDIDRKMNLEFGMDFPGHPAEEVCPGTFKRRSLSGIGHSYRQDGQRILPDQRMD